MKYFFALGFIVLALMFSQNNASALCAVNEDWSDAPCFDVLPVNRDEYREAWAPYYEYKGAEFMEQKRAELEQAIRDGTFREWAGGENSNVYHYFHSIGVVPNQYDYFFFEDEMIWQLPSFSIFPLLVLIASIIAGAAALTVVAVRTFKK